MTTYTYSISSDFPNEAIDSDKLVTEIIAAGLAGLENIGTDGDDCEFTFASNLSAGDQTILTAKVAAHDGIPEKVEVGQLLLTLPKETIGSATKSVVNDRPAITFPTGQDSWGAVSVPWPRTVDSNAELRLGICFVVAGSGSGAAVVIEGKIKAEGEGDDSGAAFSATDTDIAAVDHANPGDTFCSHLVLDVSTFNKGDSVALQIGRQGTDPSDVVGVSIHMLCLEGGIYS